MRDEGEDRKKKKLEASSSSWRFSTSLTFSNSRLRPSKFSLAQVRFRFRFCTDLFALKALDRRESLHPDRRRKHALLHPVHSSSSSSFVSCRRRRKVDLASSPTSSSSSSPPTPTSSSLLIIIITMPADKPPTHPGSTRGGDSVHSNSGAAAAGQGSVTNRAAGLVRVSLARVSAAVSDFAREVVEPPTQPVPVGATASEVAPLKTAEEGTKAGEHPLQLSTLSHDADEDGIRRRGSVFR